MVHHIEVLPHPPFQLRICCCLICALFVRFCVLVVFAYCTFGSAFCVLSAVCPGWLCGFCVCAICVLFVSQAKSYFPLSVGNVKSTQ